MHAWLCIAIVYLALLVLHFETSSMSYLSFLHGMASFGMLFQTIYLFHILAFIIPLLRLRVEPYALLMSQYVCMLA